jgi:phage shock protein A
MLPIATPSPMPEQRIKELELQLATASETVASLTRLNAELTARLSDAEIRHKKLKRSARRDESNLQDQLAAAQNKRG